MIDEVLVTGPEHHDPSLSMLVTIRRMLEGFEVGEWIVHENGQYEATARGQVVAREFARLRANLETAAVPVSMHSSSPDR